MHIRDTINKKTAFTLAEMMVILTVMSVVMAATMPIITAPDNAILGDTTSTSDYWAYNSGFKSVSTKSGKAELAGVSMQVDSGTRDYDKSSLFIKVPSGDYRNASHILFTSSPNGTQVYNAGRLYMGPAGKNNVALGAFALRDNSGDSIESVAIGSMAMYSNSIGSNNSVAIGSDAMYSRFGSAKSVAIGYRASYGNTTKCEFTTAVGYLAGAKYSDDNTSYNDDLKNTHVGKLAGYKYTGVTTEFNTNIGYQSGALKDGVASVNVGYMAGFNAGRSGKIAIGPNASAIPLDLSEAGALSYSVALGDHALYAPQADVSNSIAIGSYAGYNIRGRNPGNIFIGRKAGYWLQRGNPHENDLVVIGNYAGYKGSGVAVAIGAYAGSSSLTDAGATYDGDSIDQKERPMTSEIAIGYRSGTNTIAFNYTYGYGNISIGHSSRARGLNNIVIGRETSAEYTLGYSILLGKYATAAPALSSSANAGKEFTSLSILAFEWPKYDSNHSVDRNIYKSGFGRLLLENSSGGTSEAEAYGIRYSRTDSKDMGSMVIAPVGQSSDYSFSNSGIIFDATKLYGPSTSLSGWISSDKNLKENIEPLKYSLKDLEKFNVYEYNYRDEPSHRRIGVIAQELLKIIPEAVNTSDKNAYTVMPDWVFYPMINAIKELDKTVENCKATLVAYAKEYNTLSAKMKELETEQRQLEKEKKSLERRINKAYKKAEKMEKRV